jgi:hypothetical protein
MGVTATVPILPRGAVTKSSIPAAPMTKDRGDLLELGFAVAHGLTPGDIAYSDSPTASRASSLL